MADVSLSGLGRDYLIIENDVVSMSVTWTHLLAEVNDLVNQIDKIFTVQIYIQISDTYNHNNINCEFLSIEILFLKKKFDVAGDLG